MLQRLPDAGWRIADTLVTGTRERGAEGLGLLRGEAACRVAASRLARCGCARQGGPFLDRAAARAWKYLHHAAHAGQWPGHRLASGTQVSAEIPCRESAAPH